MLLSGEPGLGKTSLLEAARRRASDFTVLSCCGMEWEAQLPWAALHELLRPLEAQLEALPAPQRHQLDVAFGREEGEATPGLHLFAAVLDLVLDAARDAPVLLVVDDLQWVDSVSLQAFAFCLGASSRTRSRCSGRRVPSMRRSSGFRIRWWCRRWIARGRCARRAARRPCPASCHARRARGGVGRQPAGGRGECGACRRPALAAREWAAGALAGRRVDRAWILRPHPGPLGGGDVGAELVAVTVADHDGLIRAAVEARGLEPGALTEAQDHCVLVLDQGRWRVHAPAAALDRGSPDGCADRRLAHAAIAEVTRDRQLAAWHAAAAARRRMPAWPRRSSGRRSAWRRAAVRSRGGGGVRACCGAHA